MTRTEKIETRWGMFGSHYWYIKQVKMEWKGTVSQSANQSASITWLGEYWKRRKSSQPWQDKKADVHSLLSVLRIMRLVDLERNPLRTGDAGGLLQPLSSSPWLSFHLCLSCWRWSLLFKRHLILKSWGISREVAHSSLQGRWVKRPQTFFFAQLKRVGTRDQRRILSGGKGCALDQPTPAHCLFHSGRWGLRNIAMPKSEKVRPALKNKSCKYVFSKSGNEVIKKWRRKKSILSMSQVSYVNNREEGNFNFLHLCFVGFFLFLKNTFHLEEFQTYTKVKRIV